MNIQDTPLSGLKLIETGQVRDERGEFMRLFCELDYAMLRPGLRWAQINLSNTYAQGTVRGMHFQYPPAAEAKLIRCMRGRVFDVAVDLRAGSPTFLRWYAVELRHDQPLQVFIPEGFAHGFETLTDDVQLLYMHTVAWSAKDESRLRFDDPALAIDWPTRATCVSKKDASAALIDEHFSGVRL